MEEKESPDVLRLDNGPLYTHDCDKCVFLGSYDEKDMYYCPQEGLDTVIARFSDEGSDYISGLPIAVYEMAYHVSPPLRVAYLIALDLGLIKKK